MKHMNNIRHNARGLIMSKPDTAKIAHALQSHALTRVVRELALVKQQKEDDPDVKYVKAAVKNLFDVCKQADDLTTDEYIDSIAEGYELRGKG